MAGQIIAKMHDIYKTFPGVVANKGITIAFRAGEVHALLGENGAGKSTLMSILSGLYRPGAGMILIKGVPASFSSPRDAWEAGVAMIHQHFKLIPTFTVAENIVLGDKRNPLWQNMKEIKNKVRELADRYGFELNPDDLVGQLSIGEQQRVEILRALFRGGEILILDEPTTVLTPKEVSDLFGILRRMAREGKAVILITHKLKEVMAVADTVTVLRHGEVVASMSIAEADEEELARLMVGREIKSSHPARRIPGDVVLELKGVKALGDRGELALHGVDLEVRSGEILAIAGVAGNGQGELVEVIAGMRKVQAGRIFLEGTDITGCSPRDMVKKGIRTIPEDRTRVGLVRDLSVADNVILRDYYSEAYGKGCFLDAQRIRDEAQALVDFFEIKTTGIDSPVKLLSGGNQQRLLVARELAGHPKVVVAAYPSRGLDIAATENVYQMLKKAADQGTAVVLVLEDLDEIMNIADRVAVMYRGRIFGPRAVEETSLDELGRLMAGIN